MCRVRVVEQFEFLAGRAVVEALVASQEGGRFYIVWILLLLRKQADFTHYFCHNYYIFVPNSCTLVF